MRRGNFRGKITPIPPQTHSEPPLPKLERTVLAKLDQVEKIADTQTTRREIKAAVESLKASDAVLYRCLKEIETRLDSLSGRIEGVNRGLVAVGNGTQIVKKGLTSEVASLKEQISAVVESLASLNSLFGANSASIREQIVNMADNLATNMKNVSSGTSKALETALKASSSGKTGAKGLNTLAQAMLEVCNRLDSLPEPAKPVDLGPIVEEVRRYIHADKKVLRDREGNISGWTID